MTEENKDLGWLIRDTTNVIRGPFSYHEVLQLLKKKQLKNKTEISRANSYWFALEEKPELFKFFPELNDGSVAESPTQMTATLTQADMNDQRVEITQFTPTPTRKELRGETNSESSSNESQVQWLSEEFADEFGEQVTEVSMKLPKDQDDISTVADKTSELMKRSSAKNDMLPSEDKQYKGTRPMPLDSLLKHPEKNQVVSNDMNKVSDGVVNMSVDHLESHAKIIDTAEEDNKRKERISLILKIVGGVIVLVVMAGSVFYALQASNESPVEKKQKEDTVVEKKVVVQGTHLEKVSRALTIYDAEELKNSISAWEQSGEGRADHKMYLAQAILRKEFSYDADGAYTSLQQAKTLVSDHNQGLNISNLSAIYGYDKNPKNSIDTFQGLLDQDSKRDDFRYNLALSLVRSNEHTRAVPILLSLVTRLSKEDWLYARSLFLLGWTKDQISKGQDSSVESFYSRALSADPAFDKAHLALAIFKFRKAGLRNSESDFKTFIDLAPDLDPPARVRNYNVMNDDDFYSYARAQIRELNVPGGIVGGKPSSLVMAVDAILSCLQDRVGEARKILEGAIGASPGDIHVIKAIGYQRWKEGQIEDMTDLLKELPGAKTSFAVNLMLGKAFLKAGHLELAKNAFMNITDTYPNRSEGYSHLGDVFSRMKQYATSKEKYNEALRKSETDIVALRGLARRDGAFKFSKTIESLLPF